MRIFELYQEDGKGTFTHDDHIYDLNQLFAVVDHKRVHQIRTKRLTWVLKDEDYTSKRTKDADLDAPIIVTTWLDQETNKHRYVVLDGAHRVAKADILGQARLPCKYVNHAELKSCLIG